MQVEDVHGNTSRSGKVKFLVRRFEYLHVQYDTDAEWLELQPHRMTDVLQC
jgi:hypothetical protein